MRILLCTIILGWRHLGFVFPEREARSFMHTHSGLASLGFCTPRHSFWVGQTEVFNSQNELQTIWCRLLLGRRRHGLCIPSTRGEPYGGHSSLVGETYVSQSQNEGGTLWCTVILRWRNVGVALHGEMRPPWYTINLGWRN